MTETAIIELMTNKARQTIAAEIRYKRYIKRSHFVVALGLSKKGNMLLCTVSRPAQKPKHLMSHAEGAIMLKLGKKVDKIYIAKFSRELDLIKIAPCPMCAAYARNHKIKIVTLEY